MERSFIGHTKGCKLEFPFNSGGKTKWTKTQVTHRILWHNIVIFDKNKTKHNKKYKGPNKNTKPVKQTDGSFIHEALWRMHSNTFQNDIHISTHLFIYSLGIILIIAQWGRINFGGAVHISTLQREKNKQKHIYIHPKKKTNKKNKIKEQRWRLWTVQFTIFK